MKTVLIVDDVQTDRELMAQVVSKAGHHVEHAADGDEAVAKAKALKPALILLDVVMPKHDGFGACRKLKKDPETVGHPHRARHLQDERHRQVLGREAGLRRLPGEAVHPGRAVEDHPQVRSERIAIVVEGRTPIGSRRRSRARVRRATASSGSAAAATRCPPWS